MHFQKLFSQHSVFTICRFFLIHYQIRQIIISMHCVAQSITFFINMLFHRLISPFLCSLFYFSYVAGSPSHFFWHPKPIFREYFLWAFAPLAVFLLMLSAPVYLSVPHPLQHFLQEHALPGHICRKRPAIVAFPQITALFLLRAMHQHGLKTSPATTGCSYYLSECMEKHLPRFLENGTTAIICSQDTLANAALIQCQQLGYQVPDDVSIIGFDVLPIAAYTSPPLTTIRQDRIELGKNGFFALSSLLNGVSISTFLLHTQLIERKSTGNVPVA